MTNEPNENQGPREGFDKDGLPTNLSPLDPHVVAWADGRGVHLVFFDAAAFDNIPQGSIVDDHLHLAKFIITVPVWGALSMAEQMMHLAMASLRHGKSLHSSFLAPEPYDPNARHRIYARDHGKTMEEMERGGWVPEPGTPGDPIPYRMTEAGEEALREADDSNPIFRQIRDILGKEEPGSDFHGES